MKMYITMLLACSTALPLFAQETNQSARAVKMDERPPREQRDPDDRKGRPERTKEAIEEYNERKLKMMDRALDRIGVSEQERAEIIKLQEQHRELMRTNSEQIKTARKKLSDLQNGNSSEEELYAAIDEVSSAQSDQLKILVRNRMEMERILGKEKFMRFMEDARTQFKKHGRQGGAGMPDRPDIDGSTERGQRNNTAPSAD